MKDGGQAFPRNYAYMNPEAGKSELRSVDGMTMRQYYKGQALLGSLSSDKLMMAVREVATQRGETSSAILAQSCAEYADHMIAEDEAHGK